MQAAPRILQDLSKPSYEEMALRLAQLEAALAAKSSSRVSWKISDKGALSIYGLGRFPFTFYSSQWSAFRPHVEAIDAFMKDNASLLATKS